MRKGIGLRKTNNPMFKHTKRLISDILFWCKEIKIRKAENAEWERVEDEAFAELRHPMAGLGYYKTMNHNRAERKRLHEEERRAI
jgi:hypothetical protein